MYNNNMIKEYTKRKQQKYNVGYTHGQKRIYKPGDLWGDLKLAYDKGYQEGRKLIEVK